MVGSYVYTPPIWPSLLTVLLLAALAIFSWRRRAVPGARPFVIACVFALIWVGGADLAEVSGLEVARAMTWADAGRLLAKRIPDVLIFDLTSAGGSRLLPLLLENPHLRW